MKEWHGQRFVRNIFLKIKYYVIIIKVRLLKRFIIVIYFDYGCEFVLLLLFFV